MYRKPTTIYYDPGQHFDNEELQEFLHLKGVSIDYSPLGLLKLIGIVKVSNKLLEEVLKKQEPGKE